MTQSADGKPRSSMLGQRLIARGAITPDQLELALRERERLGLHLGEVLVTLGFTTEEELSTVLAEQAGVEEIDLADLAIAPEVLGLLDEAFCRRRKLMPIAADQRRIKVAMVNTFDVLAVDEVGRLTRRSVDVVAAPEPALLRALDRVFKGDQGENTEALITDARQSVSGEAGRAVDTQAVVRLMDGVFTEAVRKGATDLHIEPEERVVRCRYRVDGMLIQGATLPKPLQSAVGARVKVMAGLDISETRRPQDGKIVTRIDSRQVNMRVSTMPTVHGESIVIRILDRSRLAKGLADLGFPATNLAALVEAIRRPSGIILVTGPTGSGKTTTLYSALSEINGLERKIVTLEDPIEYELPIIRQSQVNPRAGLTFRVGLRALLRQDPDVILVGEMRDQETAEVAFRAAMTGHLVLSTLHTNSAAGAVPRLLDIGVEPYLVSSCLSAVVAQRLLRRLCPHCRVPDKAPDPEHLRSFHIPSDGNHTIYRPRGCEKCNNTGYRGRRAITEVLTVSSTVVALINQRADAAAIQAAACQEGMVLMREDARNQVLSGETSLDEALRQTWGGEAEPVPEIAEEAA